MTRMFRKAIYISRRQHVQLRRLAKARGVTEVEIIRQAIERELSLSAPQTCDWQAFSVGGVSALRCVTSSGRGHS